MRLSSGESARELIYRIYRWHPSEWRMKTSFALEWLFWAIRHIRPPLLADVLNNNAWCKGLAMLRRHQYHRGKGCQERQDAINRRINRMLRPQTLFPTAFQGLFVRLCCRAVSIRPCCFLCGHTTFTKLQAVDCRYKLFTPGMKVSSRSGQTLMAHEDLNNPEIFPPVYFMSQPKN